MKFRYRKQGWSGFGKGRVSYLADDANTFKYICTVEGVPGDWRIRLDRDYDLGPFATRDDAIQAYLDFRAKASRSVG